jgi:predicted nucleic acid-binding protein
MRVFLDANILFSAAKSTGAVRQLVDLMLAHGHACVANAFVVAEARRNLERKSAPALAEFDTLLARLEMGPMPPRTGGEHSNWLPDKDRPVLESAIAARCDALVTGDKTHFGAGFGRTYGGVTVYSPRRLAEAIL